MARSMTGFARDQVEGPWGTLEWEVRSVNHRYLDVRMRLPDVLRVMEPAFREMVGKRLSRGKVELTARLDISAGDRQLHVDHGRLNDVLAALRAIAHAAPESDFPDSLALLQYPGIRQESEPDTDAIRSAATTSLHAALDGVQGMRDEEGQRLAALLRERAKQIGQHARDAAERLPQVRDEWYDRLRRKLADLDVEVDSSRLEQELVIAAQRMDVAEELDRLHSHVDALEDALARDEPIGRRLDFLMQEFNREANTLGSKSQDTELTAHAVEMKVLIEQMREQVQNIE